MEVSAAHRLAVVVADAAAVYPVRIDPTFSNADWSSMGAGVDGIAVDALAVASDGTLYAATAYFITKWDGSAWTDLGTEIMDRVVALAVASDGTLYAGGFFTTAADEVSAYYIAKWNGSAWSPLGTGMDNVVSGHLI
jgi:uncharacterized membrane protein